MGAKELPRVSQAYDNAFLIGSGMFQVCVMDFKNFSRGWIVGVLEYHFVYLKEYPLVN